MKESLRRISIGVAVGAVLLFVGMFAFTKPAHAHGGGDVGRAFVGVLGAATAIAIIDTVAYRRGYMPAPVVYAPQPYMVQPQPVYVVQPPPPVLCRYTAVDIYTVDGQYVGREPRQICR